MLDRPQQPKIVNFLGSIMGASGFTVFFGGTYLDCLSAAIIAVLIVLLQMFLAGREKNQIVYHFVISVAAGVAALFWCSWDWETILTRS